MTSPNSSYATDVLSTTMQYLEGKPFDQITANTALNYHLKRKGRIKAIDGGPSIVVPLAYNTNSNYVRMSGAEQIPIAAQQTFTVASYPWKQAAITCSITGLEEIMNAGRSQVVDLLEARVENAMISATNSFDADCWSNGTASDGKQIGGMQLLFADTPNSGTVGGIDRSSWTFWQHTVKDATSDFSAAVSATNIYQYMAQMLNAIDNRSYPVDIILCDNNYFTFFESALFNIQRLTNDSGEMGKAGFKSYTFRNGIEVVLAGGLSGNCPANHMYFIAGDTIELRYFKGRNWTKLAGDRRPVNQDVKVEILTWAGNLVSKAPRYNAVLKD